MFQNLRRARFKRVSFLFFVFFIYNKRDNVANDFTGWPMLAIMIMAAMAVVVVAVEIPR